MTTFPFSPSPSQPFQFQPTLDGNPYNVIVTWNLFGQRYYVNLYDVSGALVVARALVGGVNLAFGFFASTLVYRPGTNDFEALP